MSKADRRNASRASNRSARTDRNGVPTGLATIPLADPHALPADPSLGDLVKDATAQISTLVRAEVELARAEITRDVKKGLTGSVFFIAALVVLFYSTFFFFFFVAELLNLWLQSWAAYLIVFGLMLVFTVALALIGYLRVRRIRGPRKTIETVREAREALRPDPDRLHGASATAVTDGKPTTDPSGW
ncbi:phage holin family protein [Mycobacterium sp. UM_Kg1]|uniref:phage holin family protein n=1 Tax=Mycobacterium sp. UM_Kg1 TaxID=1545691 RepID=UPI00061B2A34|nr:phage holin family protein [Mycobacterium sp. UM_Kg1]